MADKMNQQSSERYPTGQNQPIVGQLTEQLRNLNIEAAPQVIEVVGKRCKELGFPKEQATEILANSWTTHR